MFYVYILRSLKDYLLYIGFTSYHPDKRLKEHNSGGVKSSSPYRPYKVIYAESFATLSEARQKEKFYKSTTGRRRLKEMLFE